MVRIQIQLEPAQHRQVKQRARRAGISVSEYIRRAVEDRLRAAQLDERDDRARRALAVSGKYTDPRGTGIAANHDSALAEAFRR